MIHFASSITIFISVYFFVVFFVSLIPFCYSSVYIFFSSSSSPAFFSPIPRSVFIHCVYFFSSALPCFRCVYFFSRLLHLQLSFLSYLSYYYSFYMMLVLSVFFLSFIQFLCSLRLSIYCTFPVFHFYRISYFSSGVSFSLLFVVTSSS